MSVVSLLGVKHTHNPARFTDKYALEITFECLEPLTKDLEWKLTYVGSATSSDYDQELDTLLVGPIPEGVNKFVFEAEAPNISRLPAAEVLGVTVLLLTCSYDGREFVRVGYYVNNEYDNEEMNREPPKQLQVPNLMRNILAEKPRVTRFAIKWDSEESAPAEYPPDQPEADQAEDDEEKYAGDETDLDAVETDGAPRVDIEDTEMGGAEDTSGPPPAKIDEGAESEDLEADSTDEEEEEDDGEDEEMADGDAEMGDAAPAAVAPGGAGQTAPIAA